jgi:D-xylose transport system permease protein
MAGDNSDFGGMTPEQIAAQAENAPDLTAAAVEIPPSVTAQSLDQYLRSWLVRVKSGDAGVLPVVAALIIVAAVFWWFTPNHVYLKAVNLVNLFDQSSVFIVLGVAEIFVLLLGEIDLSIGYVAAIGGIVAALLVQPSGGAADLFHNWPWWGAIAAALVVCALIGGLQGLIVTRLRLPSFVVTLAGQMFWFGVMIIIIGPAGGVSIANGGVVPAEAVLYGIVYTFVDPLMAWVGLALILLALGGAIFWRDSSRRRSGLVAPPVGLTFLKIGFLVVVGVIVLLICNQNRSTGTRAIIGVPWVLPLVLAVVGGATLLLERTQFGRHMYAVGGNPEAARRAGVGVNSVRTWAFVICSTIAGLGGIIYCSTLGNITTNINGGQYVLFAVAAAVIGGTSLMGGRGRAIHGLLGGLTIGAIYNGLFLLAFPVEYQYIATGLVLLAAVAVDALSRRSATSGSMARV